MLPDEAHRVRDQRDEARRCLAAVRNLHRDVQVRGVSTCQHCQVPAPCPTIRAVKGQPQRTAAQPD